MRRTIAALSIVALVGIAGAPAAVAKNGSPNLGGTWKAASLKMNGVGYQMKLSSQDNGTDSYAGTLRMHFQDGTKGPRIAVTVSAHENAATMKVNGTTLKGSIGQDGSLFFPTCYKTLKYVPKKAADSMCLFQEVPR